MEFLFASRFVSCRVHASVLRVVQDGGARTARAAEYESRFPPRMGASSFFVSTAVFGVLSLPVGFREN